MGRGVNRWPAVKLAHVLEPAQRPEVVDATREYRLLGVRLESRGPFLREIKTGAETSAKTLFRVRAGDFIYSRLFAWRGAFGVIPPQLDGCYVSNEFPIFVSHDGGVDPQYLNYWFRLPAILERIAADCTGSTPLTRNRYKEHFFLELEIPLPPIEEQRQVVEKLDQLAVKTQRIGRLSSIIAGEAVALWRVELECRFAEPSAARVRLEDACEAVIDNLHTTPRYTGDDFACVRSQDVGWGSINYGTALRTDETEFLQRTRRAEPRAGDIVYVREGDIGRCAVVDGSHRFSLGQRVMMLRPDADTVNSDYLMFQLMSPAVLDEQVLASQMGTTSRHINVKVLRSVMVVIPPLHRQMKVVASLRRLAGLQAVSDRLRSHVRMETDVLSASALSTGFGEDKRR